ncbi:pyridoxal phosphate-dependent aminotransferase [Peptoniphilus asaccharolyticus]
MKDKHGANIFELSREYGFEENEIADFSSNINPMGPSKFAMDFLKDNLNLITTYPDPEYVSLRDSISTYSGAKPENIVLGAGTTELFKQYVELISPKRALLLSPCYSEYENELRSVGAEIFYENLLEENEYKIDLNNIINTIKSNAIEMLIFANPNNPTGTILTRKEIGSILETGINVLVDETYVEFTDKDKFSSVELTNDYSNLFVARGVSKFFASPGIRLGYGITSNREFLDTFEHNSMLWNVNIFADILGQKMFQDKAYQSEVFNFMNEQREYFFGEISTLSNIKYFPSYGNFILCKILNQHTAAELREHLLKKALVIRDCSSFKNLSSKHFRFCILSKEDNQKLIRELKKYFKSSL